jgi:hypothetical protein
MATITAAEFASKYRNKTDLERFLRMQMKASLPDHKYVSTYFYRSLLSGDKEVSDFDKIHSK